MRILTFIVAFLIVSLSNVSAQNCVKVRAGIDIGSGTTKMVVARTNACTNVVLRVLAPAAGAKLERTVKFKKNTITAQDGRKVFSVEIIEQSIQALTELKEEAIRHGAEEFSAVATSAFRNVDREHAISVAGRIRSALGIPVRIISQDEEARIGFFGASVRAGVPLKNLLVWDIGGGSMQLSRWVDKEGKIESYKSTFANEEMHRYIIEELQNGDYARVNTPNPIGTNDLYRTIRRAAQVASESIPESIVQAIRSNPAIQAIGIGGVHFYSNCEVMKRFASDGCRYGREELRDQISANSHLTDAELVQNGLSASIDYAPYRISGGALTVGFMQVIGLEFVRSLKVDMSDGILIDAAYWKN